MCHVHVMKYIGRLILVLCHALLSVMDLYIQMSMLPSENTKILVE
ncbi:hypothetical protein M3J09_000785 [Ascochyta lentis]